jgi:hypothetical protein
MKISSHKRSPILVMMRAPNQLLISMIVALLEFDSFCIVAETPRKRPSNFIQEFESNLLHELLGAHRLTSTA